MTRTQLFAPLFVVAALALPAMAADTSVTLSDVHLCCGSCVTGVAKAVGPVTGAKAECDTDKKTVTITAPDNATAQKAVDALTAAGYFGKSSNAAIKVDAATNAPDGKVTSLEITGVHLCCGSCVTTVKGILEKLPGVTGNTVKSRATSFTVTGDFNAKAVFDELQKAGLTGKAAAH